MASCIAILHKDEIPRTYEGFVEKWNSDHIWRNRAKCSGIYLQRNGSIIFENIGKTYIPKDLIKSTVSK